MRSTGGWLVGCVGESTVFNAMLPAFWFPAVKMPRAQYGQPISPLELHARFWVRYELPGRRVESFLQQKMSQVWTSLRVYRKPTINKLLGRL